MVDCASFAGKVGIFNASVSRWFCNASASAIDGLRRLKDELLTAKDTYIQTATELAKGLKVSVDGLDQLEKLTTKVSNLQRQAAEATQKHSTALEEQGKIVANTTNTISRQLMEQERVNRPLAKPTPNRRK